MSLGSKYTTVLDPLNKPKNMVKSLRVVGSVIKGKITVIEVSGLYSYKTTSKFLVLGITLEGERDDMARESPERCRGSSRYLCPVLRDRDSRVSEEEQESRRVNQEGPTLENV